MNPKNYNSTICPWCRSTNTQNLDLEKHSEKRYCCHCRNDYIVEYHSEDNEVIKNITDGHNRPFTYTWKDLVTSKNAVYALEFEISGDIDELEDGNFYYQIDDFLKATAKKIRCNENDIKTYMMDGENFTNINYDPQSLPFGAESCGAYINGISEFELVRME